LKLGGEGKTVSYEKLDKPRILETYTEASAKLSSNLVKLCLASPTFLPENFEEALKKKGCSVQAAMIGKALSIGGFDYKERKPKPMQKAIPPGSVYIVGKEGAEMLSWWQELFKDVLSTAQNSSYINRGFNAFHVVPVLEAEIK